MNGKFKNKVGEVALLIWGVPKKLKSNFKSKCADRGESMKEAIIRLLELYNGKKW